MESNLWPYFKCQRCGRCCENSGLPWDPDNIEKMAEFLKMDSENLVNRYYGDIYWENGERFIRWDETRRKPCPFLGEDKSCKIYPIRPMGCKAYLIDTHLGRGGVDCPAMKIVDEADSEKKKSEDKLMDKIYLLFVNPENEGISCPPFAYICLGSHSRPDICGVEHIALSAKCTSYEEVKGWAAYIQKHLDRVVKEAEEKFRKAKKRNGGR